MTAPLRGAMNGDSVAALNAALSAGTREAFTSLLSEDVRWGGERRGGAHECTNREQAGDHYASLLSAGLTLRIIEAEPDLAASRDIDGEVLNVQMRVQSPDPDDFPPQMAVRLTVRMGLISDICILDTPPTIEVLYFEGCPHHEAFLPHLRELLTAHGITAEVTLVQIETDEEAQENRFLGSPTVRVDGHDVEPATAEREHRDSHVNQGRDSASHYAMQCRMYPSADGIASGFPRDQWILDALIENPVHEAAVAAVRHGNVAALQQLLAKHPDLPTTRLARHEGRTLLHVATDWPGHFPHAGAAIAALVAAGADPDAGSFGEHPETPLHWAASSDDIAAIDALLDAGADINAPGAVIAGGTPMADATAFGQWAAARRLLERGADTNLFEAAALGLVSEVRRHLEVNEPTAATITSSFWGACHGGHIATAAVLLEHHADINWVGYDDLTPLDAARRAEAPAMVDWLVEHGATSATLSG